MKKILSILLACIMLAGCRTRPDTYEYYNDFVKPVAGEITPVETDGYTDTTKEENLALLQSKVGLENLTGHSLYEKKKAVVLNLYFDGEADNKQIDKAREYAYETFWEGRLHTADVLPYEDWQYSHMIKDFCLQIYNHDQLVLQDVYSFDQLTDSGEKLYHLTTSENTDIVFNGTYIYLGDWLKGTQEQLDAYANIDSYADMTVHTSIRQTLCKDKMYVMLLTEEKQIDPYRLKDIYDTVYERYSFINENLYIQLCVSDSDIYFEYNGETKLPVAEEE